ncbi:MAG: hypothetical protein KGJ42_05795 [Acidobacteriota bacterium]|nr:hypothetical protein [Acidobacteriota bacterium]
MKSLIDFSVEEMKFTPVASAIVSVMVYSLGHRLSQVLKRREQVNHEAPGVCTTSISEIAGLRSINK